MIVYKLFLSCLLRYKYYHFQNKRLLLIFQHHSQLTKVRTRSQLENLSKLELIEELFTVDDLSTKLSDIYQINLMTF